MFKEISQQLIRLLSCRVGLPRVEPISFSPTAIGQYTSGMLAELAKDPANHLIPEVVELYNATHNPRPLRYSAGNLGRFGTPTKLRPS